jgi:DNA invertase Pin-like site-specific DNA recombinase
MPVYLLNTGVMRLDAIQSSKRTSGRTDVNRPLTPKDMVGLAGAWYARISLDEGVQEIASQRDNLERWLAQFGLSVQSQFRFEDAAGYTPRHRPDDRPEFQRLMAAVRGGLVKWVVVDHQYRIGGKDEWHYASLIHQFRQAGCHVWTISGDLLTGGDGLAFFQGGFRAKSSEAEQEAKSHHVLRGMRRTAKAGEWTGGYVPYGLDVVCIKGDVEKWRLRWHGHFQRTRIWPNGDIDTFDGKGNMPAVENKEVLRLAPGDPERLEVVRWLFERFATESISTYQLAKALNQRGVKPTYNETWLASHVVAILGNPAYVGKPAWNKFGQGEFLEDFGTGPQKVVAVRGRRTRAKAAWVLPDHPVFTPIITDRQWQAVQEKLGQPVKRRAPKTADLWLAGLVHCAHCGVRMRGQKRRRYSQFLCQTGDRRRMGVKDISCLRNTLHHEVVEEIVSRWLLETGKSMDTLAEAQQNGDMGLLGTLEGEFKGCLDAYFAVVKRQCDFIGRCLPVEQQAEAPPDYSLDALYRKTYSASGEHLRQRLAELEAEHTHQMGFLERFQGIPRALKKKQEELAVLEAQLEETERLLTDVSGEAGEQIRRLEEVRALILQAESQGEGEHHVRAKAEAIRRLVERIDVVFTPTGKKYPQSVPEAVVIVPKSGPEVRYDVSG